MIMLVPKVKIPKDMWNSLIKELKLRGKKNRESGAFLLSDVSDNRVKEYICFDDLDPHCLDEGYINFNGDGFIPLWKYCAEQKLKVICDVHTHPGRRTNQSILDQNNPMIAIAGHVALIVPNFACNQNQLLNGVGIFEYVGNFNWNSFAPKSGIVIIE